MFSTAGDAFAASFWAPSNAVAAATVCMRRLADEPWPDGCEIRVRAGIHMGVADERGGGYFGPPLNRTARLMAPGRGGQVLVSAAAAGLLPGVDLVDLGEHRLKDLSAPEHISQLAWCGSHLPLRRCRRVVTTCRHTT